MASPTARPVRIAGLALAGGALLGLLVLERTRALRPRAEPGSRRLARNALLGAMSLGVVQVLQQPMAEPLAQLVERRRFGLAQRLPVPPILRDAAAFLFLDWTIYLWHVGTHRVPALWRLHRVHHVDLDLDASTALRFHLVEMAVSIPYRAAQIILGGVSPRALQLWQSFFFAAVLFHHSNLRLPPALERRLGRLLVTPRMHGVHHHAVLRDTDSNWSSGLSIWDRLHGTYREAPQNAARIGVETYADPVGIEESLRLPFQQRRDWLESDLAAR